MNELQTNNVNEKFQSETSSDTADLPDLKKINPSEFLRKELETELKNVENQQDGKKDDKNSQVTDKKLSRVEEEAMAKGWLPKELFKGESDNWVSAPQFLKTRSLIENSKAQNDLIKNLQNKVDRLYEIAQMQAKSSAEQRSKELMEKKRQAIKDSNIEDAEKYEKMYYESQTQNINAQEQKTQNYAQQQFEPEVMQFMERNREWYNNSNPLNIAMSTYAYQMNEIMRRDYPQWDVARRLGEVELAVQRQFPDTFHNKERDKASPVEGSRRITNQASGYPQFEELPRKWQDIIDNFIKNPIVKLTREEYIKELVKNGALSIA